MALSDAQTLFAAGMERAAQHWLVFWQHNGHDSEAQRQARGHTLRALMWCADWGMVPDTIADLAVALQGHMMRTGQWSEWEPCLHKVFDRIRPHINDAHRYELQHCLATLCFRLHRLDDAIALAEDNRRIALAAADTDRQEQAAIILAETYLNVPRYDVALAYAEHATDLAVTLGDAVREADGHINTARALLGLSKIADAEQHLARAYTLATAADSAVYRCKAQLFLGHAAAARQEWQRSLDYCSHALTLVQQYGDEAGYGVVLTNMGRALIGLRRWDEAKKVFEQALRIHRFHGNAPAERVCLGLLAELHAHRSEERNP